LSGRGLGPPEGTWCYQKSDADKRLRATNHPVPSMIHDLDIGSLAAAELRLLFVGSALGRTPVTVDLDRFLRNDSRKR